MVATAQHPNQRLYPRAKATRRHFPWPLGAICLTTMQAVQGMRLVFNHFWYDGRQFTHLMPLWLRVFSQQQGATSLTTNWLTDDKVIDLFWRFQRSVVTHMARLSPCLTLLFHFGGWFLHIQRVTRWRHRRIARVLPYLFFQLADAFLRLGDGLLQFIDNPQQHVDCCLHTRGSGFPILV